MSNLDITELRNRDEKALSAFHRQLAPKVRRVVSHVLRRRHALEVEDIVNEIFLRIFSRLDDLTKLDSASKLESYCLKVAHNIALEYSRRFDKEDSIIELYESQVETVDLPKVDEQIDEQERQEALQDFLTKLLAKMPPLERQILQMHLSSEMSLEEISNELGMDISTTRYTVVKAMAKLRYAVKQSLKQRTQLIRNAS